MGSIKKPIEEKKSTVTGRIGDILILSENWEKKLDIAVRDYRLKRGKLVEIEYMLDNGLGLTTEEEKVLKRAFDKQENIIEFVGLFGKARDYFEKKRPEKNQEPQAQQTRLH